MVDKGKNTRPDSVITFSNNNAYIDIDGIALLNGQDRILQSVMDSYGLTEEVMRGLLDGRYNKIITDRGDARTVWTYNSRGSKSMCAGGVYVTNGDRNDYYMDVNISREIVDGVARWSVIVYEL